MCKICSKYNAVLAWLVWQHAWYAGVNAWLAGVLRYSKKLFHRRSIYCVKRTYAHLRYLR